MGRSKFSHEISVIRLKFAAFSAIDLRSSLPVKDFSLTFLILRSMVLTVMMDSSVRRICNDSNHSSDELVTIR